MIDLTEQVSQLVRLEDETLRAVQREVSKVEAQWTNVYSDYHTGGWQTVSLLNSTSSPTDTLIEDCEPVETSLLERMPDTRSLLKGLGFRYMWARLAKLEVNAFLHEHRDYQELKNVRRLRLHIPIITNPFSSIVIDRTRIHLALGYIWKLNPIYRHAAGNFGKEARIHIILDCYVDDALDALVQRQTLDPICVYGLPLPSALEIEEAVSTAQRLAVAGDHTSAEHHILKMFHEYSLGEGDAYDLVSRMYGAIGDSRRSAFWLNNRIKFLEPAKALAVSG
ncbi:MAG: aspartyl/asparaginyl beta-hydroxylase domain-containing protein [Pyrinomonadaceae bacterium]